MWVVGAPCVQKAVLKIYCRAITMRTFRERLTEKNFVKELAARAILERKKYGGFWGKCEGCVIKG